MKIYLVGFLEEKRNEIVKKYHGIRLISYVYTNEKEINWFRKVENEDNIGYLDGRFSIPGSE